MQHRRGARMTWQMKILTGLPIQELSSVSEQVSVLDSPDRYETNAMGHWHYGNDMSSMPVQITFKEGCMLWKENNAAKLNPQRRKMHSNILSWKVVSEERKGVSASVWTRWSL